MASLLKLLADHTSTFRSSNFWAQGNLTEVERLGWHKASIDKLPNTQGFVINEWIETICGKWTVCTTGDYVNHTTWVYFEKEEDCLLFKLTWL